MPVLSDEDVARGYLTGTEQPSTAPGAVRVTPRQALDEVLIPLLQHTPCVVAFSGGRDSSVLLAAAVDIARRHGLPMPTALTLRYPGVSAADETAWQERVVRHLRLDSWTVLDVQEDGHDLLGPAARDSLRRWGLLFPPTVHTRGDLLQHARGGCLLTGDGGDEIFGELRATPLARLLTGDLGRPTSRQAALALAPRSRRYRSVHSRLRRSIDWPWLIPEVRVRFVADLARDTTDRPLVFSAALLDVVGRRSAAEGLRNLQMVALAHAVNWVHPLSDPRFLAALGRAHRPWGPASRTSALMRNFAGLLPLEVLQRETKAEFSGAYFGRCTDRFTRQWDGTGVPEEFVAVDALRQLWSSGRRHAGTSLLLQAAWLKGTDACWDD